MVQALRLATLGVVFACGAAAAQQVPTCTVTSTPETILGGGNVTVTWSATGATSCVASGGWSGVRDCAGGTITFPVTQTRTFTMIAKAAQGKVTAKWTKPTQNTDGSAATITGYKLYVANAPSQVPDATPQSFPATTLEHVFWRDPGDVSAGVKSVRSDGVDSGFSNISSKSVVAASATCKDTTTVEPRPKAPSLTLSWLKELFTGKPKPNDS